MANRVENEITAFIVLDVHAYHEILKKIVANVSRVTYQKCLYYNYNEHALRVIATHEDPIDPVAFDSRVGPYQYLYDLKKNTTKPNRCNVPVWIDGIMCFLNVTVKSSTETPLEKNSDMLKRTPDELRGKYRKEFIVDRAVIYQKTINGNVCRASVNKKCKFSGNGEFRQPDVPVYILEYEVEYPSESCIRDNYNIRQTCHDLVEICLKQLKVTVDEMYNIIRSGQNNCLPESDLFISILNTYKRKFIATCPPNIVKKTDSVYLCKKWDGIRAMGLWKGSELILYSGDFGFKYFTVPAVFAPDIIVQVEYFRDTDSFIVTEIFAITNIEMDTDFVYFTRRSGNACRFGEGLYNGSNTSIQLQDNRVHLMCDVNPLDSISCIQKLNKHHPNLFTTHYKVSEWPIDLRHAVEVFNERSDGILLKIFSKSQADPTYYKIKNIHTIELLYSARNHTFISMNGTVYNDIIESWSNFQFKYLTNKYSSLKQDVTMEFSVYGNKLRFKCIRYDKIGPDGDKKIQNIMKL